MTDVQNSQQDVTNPARVSVIVPEGATMQDVRTAFQAAALDVMRRGIVEISNGEIPAVGSKIKTLRFSDDLYAITGFSIGGEAGASQMANRLRELQANPLPEMTVPGTYVPLVFQHGFRGNVGFNGITIESLLAICHDRLSLLNVEPYQCAENDQAIEHLEMALALLQNRAQRRIEEGSNDTALPDEGTDSADMPIG